MNAKILFIITAFTFIQCVSTMDKNKEFSQKKVMEDIADTSYVINNFDKMGKDLSNFLNDYEAEYFNKNFKNNDINFIGKKVCFFGPGGLVLSDKQKFFNNLKENNFVVHTDLYVFNESQKEEIGGYDAAIVYWSKRLFHSNDIIKRLKK